MRIATSEKRSKYDREFRDGAVRIVGETKKPMVELRVRKKSAEGRLGPLRTSR